MHCIYVKIWTLCDMEVVLKRLFINALCPNTLENVSDGQPTNHDAWQGNVPHSIS